MVGAIPSLFPVEEVGTFSVLVDSEGWCGWWWLARIAIGLRNIVMHRITRIFLAIQQRNARSDIACGIVVEFKESSPEEEEGRESSDSRSRLSREHEVDVKEVIKNLIAKRQSVEVYESLCF